MDTVVEWLTRCPAKALPFGRMSSNLIGVVYFLDKNSFHFIIIPQMQAKHKNKTRLFHPCRIYMLADILKWLLEVILRLLGIGFSGIGEFEAETSFRRTLNCRIQKEKSDSLPLFDGTLQDVRSLVYNIFYFAGVCCRRRV